ncbi:cysteine desulfurase, SufS subfamily [Oribacterium parvum ACB1]|uniref:Cysteine desulfurase n=1 Tax=Oribacterium parvum ACB1 TaxID=796943 RepID=G9WMN2_9FIRM|nr:SufS family cysteine desulfurase [Oribacterium parvum]EHL11785.1 cysteine desulfurase, SufS subfamily [Oribacterium parvum ACB1]EJF13572.1 cysteine desulfurase, SufS family [Oribacterium parvum ACB8]
MEEREKEIARIKADFPIFKSADFFYLDNAATTQKPYTVLEAMKNYYETENANPLRGLYELSLKATEAYEKARVSVQNFLNAKSAEEIIFVRNATEGLNLVAQSYGRAFLKEGDEILITIMEHHSNLIPWQQIAKEKGAKLTFLEPNEEGLISLESFKKALNDKVKIVAMAEVSNVLGNRQDIETFVKLTHENNAIFVCDGAQSVPHRKVDVQAMDVDFLAFSGHKVYGPMGIGAVYGKKELLEKMPPFLFGGEMIEYVTKEDATWAELPHKFEAGTVNVGGAVGLEAAIQYIEKLGFSFIEEREKELSEYLMAGMKEIPHVHILGSEKGKNHHGIMTFTIDGVHPHDIAEIMDSHKVCIRAGHHCAQPLMKFMGTPSTSRVSLGLYNTKEDVDAFLAALKTIRGAMGYGE